MARCWAGSQEVVCYHFDECQSPETTVAPEGGAEQLYEKIVRLI